MTHCLALTAVGLYQRRILMFRFIAHFVVPVGVVSAFILASVANAQISPNLPNPTGAPNPLTTLSIFRSNMQDKIMKAADAMPESKYSYRPTKDVRSFGEIVTHVADISYTLCSNVKGEATPATATREQRGATSERVYVPRAGPSIIYGMPHASQRDRGPLHRNGSSYYPATTRRQRLRAI